jgi:capsular polysaccharide biosynthesis protein
MSSEYEISMRDFLRVLFKKKRVVITVFLLGLITTYVYINMTVPVYESVTKILVSSARKTSAPSSTELDSIRRAQPNVTQGEIIKGGVILEAVVRKLELDKRDDEVDFYPKLKKILQPLIDQAVTSFKDSVQLIKTFLFGSKAVRGEISPFDEALEILSLSTDVLQVQDSDVFYLSVSDYDPVMARRLTNAIVREFFIYDLRQQVLNLKTQFGDDHPRILQLKDVITRVESASEEVKPDEVEGLGFLTIKVLDEAKTPYKPVKPNQRLLYIIVAIAGLCGGLSLAFILTAIDNAIKNPWELEILAGLPVLASIPFLGGHKFVLARLASLPVHLKKKLSAYDRVSDRIFMLSREENQRIFLITDINDPCNSARNAYFIANALAGEYRLKTILLDCDLRKPVLPEALAGKGKNSLNRILDGKEAFTADSLMRRGELDLLLASPEEARSLLFLPGKPIADLLAVLKRNYDVVIVHAPDLSHSDDAIILARSADAVIVSMREDLVKREIAVNAVNSLKKGQTTVLGAVYNDRSHPIPGMIYRNV